MNTQFIISCIDNSGTTCVLMDAGREVTDTTLPGSTLYFGSRHLMFQAMTFEAYELALEQLFKVEKLVPCVVYCQIEKVFLIQPKQ